MGHLYFTKCMNLRAFRTLLPQIIRRNLSHALGGRS